MKIAGSRVTVKLTFLLILVPHLALAKEAPKAEEQKKESTTKDLKVASTSYVYSKTGNGLGPFDHLGPARFRSVHGLHSGLNFPRSLGGFNFPTKYRVGSFGGVGSGIDDISSDLGSRSFSLSHGLGKKSFISSLDGDDIGSSIGLHHHGPSTFELESHDESEDLLGRHEPEDDEKHHEKGEKSTDEHESSSEEEGSKGYKVDEHFDKSVKKEKEKGQESGHFHEEAGENKGHEDEARKYKEKEESAHEAKGEHFAHNEGHKKGHKTSGYHNVYHKDEYKKDTTFYDDEHVDAQQEQYSHEDHEHAKAEAEHKKAEKHDAAYEQAEKARKGFFTNGHQYGVAHGHDREDAVKEHHEKEHEAHKEAKHKSASEQSESSHSHR